MLYVNNLNIFLYVVGKPVDVSNRVVPIVTIGEYQPKSAENVPYAVMVLLDILNCTTDLPKQLSL